MLETTDGCPDNVKVRTYAKGKEYNLPEELARVFIDIMKVAEEVKPVDVVKTPLIPPKPPIIK